MMSDFLRLLSPANSVQTFLLVFGAILALIYAGKGWSNGLSRSIWKLLILLVAGATTWVFAPFLIQHIPESMKSQAPFHPLVVGAALFLLSWLVLYFLGRGMFTDSEGRRLRPGILSRLTGACFGIAVALVLVFGITVGLRWFGTVSEIQAASASLARAPQTGTFSRKLQNLKNDLMEGSLGKLLAEHDPTPDRFYGVAVKFAKLVRTPELHRAFLARPEVAALLKNERYLEAANDPTLRSLVSRRQYSEIIRHPLFDRLANDPVLRKTLESTNWEQVLDEVLADTSDWERDRSALSSDIVIEEWSRPD